MNFWVSFGNFDGDGGKLGFREHDDAVACAVCMLESENVDFAEVLNSSRETVWEGYKSSGGYVEDSVWEA